MINKGILIRTSASPTVANSNQPDSTMQPGSTTPPTASLPSPQNQSSSGQSSLYATGRRISAPMQRRLSDLPVEILARIATAVVPRDCIALAHSNGEIFRSIQPELRAALEEMRADFIAQKHAATVNTLADFNRSLQMVQELPPSLQGAPLAALSARIPHFPVNEQQAAIDAFLANTQNLSAPRPALLDELMQAAANGPGGLAQREQNAFNGPARTAVRNGEPVTAATQRFGITETSMISRLEHLSIRGPAGAAVENGEPVPAVAQRFGITSASAILWLENLSVRGPAGAAVRNGVAVPEAVQQFGIRGEDSITWLEALTVNRTRRAAE